MKSTQPETSGDFTNSIGMKFNRIPAGEFSMGRSAIMGMPPKEDGPPHKVRITKPFYIGVTEVTQGQYEKEMGSNPSGFSKTGLVATRVRGMDTYDFPVECISWENAVEFCEKLSVMEGRSYRLPTEAEWEYACRAGSDSRYCFGDDLSKLDEYAWFGEPTFGDVERIGQTHPVAQKEPNAWGLYDMHGNVWEYCQDWYDERYYARSPVDDPPGPEAGTTRVYRGGAWRFSAFSCRSVERRGELPAKGKGHIDRGFRVVLVPSTDLHPEGSSRGSDVPTEVSNGVEADADDRG